MALDKTVFSGALKEFFLPVLREQLVFQSEYLTQIERGNEDVEGLEAVLSLHVGRNEGIGARKEMEDLPAPGNQSYTKARVGLKYNYAQFQLSGPVMRSSDTDRGGWVRPLESESKGVVVNLREDVDRQLTGTSDGVLAATALNAGATNDVITSATATQLRYLRPNMKVDIGTVANPTSVAEARTITAVDRATKTITISGAAVTTATTDRVFRHGSGGSGSDQREITGIQTIVDSTGTLFGVDPTVYPEWAAYEKDASAAALSDAMVGELIDEIALTSPAGVPNWAFTTHSQVRKYAASQSTLRRFVNTVDLKFGFKGVEISSTSGSLAVSALRNAPAEQFFAVNTNHLKLHTASDWEFMDEDGSVLTRVETGNGKDAYKATLFQYAEQMTDVRSAHGKIVNLAA